MEMDNRKPFCPILDVDGVISGGKQFDLDITLPEDNRDVIYGVVKNCFKEPVSDAVVKLVEVVCEHDKEERRPIGHTFTDKEGEFVFGPLCPGKEYSLQIWVNDTKKIKICAKCHHEGKCLKGEKHDKCDCFIDDCDKHDKHDKCNNCKKYDMYEKYDEYEKQDECKKWDKCEKHDECKKCDKCEKHDECKTWDKCEKHDEYKKWNKCEKYDDYNKCNKCEKNDEHKKEDCFKKPECR